MKVQTVRITLNSSSIKTITFSYGSKEPEKLYIYEEARLGEDIQSKKIDISDHDYIYQIATVIDKEGYTRGIEINTSDSLTYKYGLISKDKDCVAITTFQASPGTAIVGVITSGRETTGVLVHKLWKQRVIYAVSSNMNLIGKKRVTTFHYKPLTLQEKQSLKQHGYLELDVENGEVIKRVNSQYETTGRYVLLKIFTNFGRVWFNGRVWYRNISATEQPNCHVVGLVSELTGAIACLWSPDNFKNVSKCSQVTCTDYFGNVVGSKSFRSFFKSDMTSIQVRNRFVQKIWQDLPNLNELNLSAFKRGKEMIVKYIIPFCLLIKITEIKLNNMKSTRKFHLHLIKLLKQFLSLRELRLKYRDQPNQNDYSKYYVRYSAGFPHIVQNHDCCYGDKKKGTYQTKSLTKFVSLRNEEFFLQLLRRSGNLASGNSNFFRKVSKQSMKSLAGYCIRNKITFTRIGSLTFEQRLLDHRFDEDEKFFWKTYVLELMKENVKLIIC